MPDLTCCSTRARELSVIMFSVPTSSCLPQGLFPTRVGCELLTDACRGCLDVTGGQWLDLIADDAGDGNSSDHVDWADATLVCG